MTTRIINGGVVLCLSLLFASSVRAQEPQDLSKDVTELKQRFEAIEKQQRAFEQRQQADVQTILQAIQAIETKIAADSKGGSSKTDKAKIPAIDLSPVLDELKNLNDKIDLLGVKVDKIRPLTRIRPDGTVPPSTCEFWVYNETGRSQVLLVNDTPQSISERPLTKITVPCGTVKYHLSYETPRYKNSDPENPASAKITPTSRPVTIIPTPIQHWHWEFDPYLGWIRVMH